MSRSLSLLSLAGRRWSRFALPLTVSLLCVAPPASGEAERTSSEAGTSITVGRYVVRQGDTLERLGQQILGSSARWREIWQLNPEVTDPNRIQPGTTLRVPVDRVPSDGALLVGRANRVEYRLQPFPWSDAERGDILAWRDSLRTYTASSAELAFRDQTSLQVSEETLVFLDPTGPRSRARSTEPDRIEIVRGQADLLARSNPTERATDSSFELVLGDTVAVPSRTESGALEARARRVEDGARVMVYAGSGEVASGGESVALTEGTGSAVTDGKAPGPPETLLPAPQASKPKSGARRASASPEFSWESVDGAASYIVEVCFDANCAELAARQADLEATAWRPETLEPGEYHWRITARSASGLDGFPSATRSLALTDEPEDTVEPTVAFRFEGPYLAPRWGIDDRWILGPGALLAIDASDEGSGVDGWTARLDDEAVDPDVLASRFVDTWSPGEQTLVVTASDQAENESVERRVVFYDTEPPRLTWGIENDVASGPVTPLPLSQPLSESAPLEKQPAVAVLEGRHPKRCLLRRHLEWTVTRDPRQILLHPARKLRIVVDAGDGPSAPLEIGPERGLWILGVDDGTGFLDRFEYSLNLPERRGGGVALELTAADAVGNGTEARLELRAAGRR